MRRIILLLAIFLGLLSGCLPREEEPLPPPVVKSYEPEPPKTAAVKRGELVKMVKLSPAYRPISEQNYYFAAAGYFIDTVYVKQGDEVHAGDLLAKLDTSDLILPIADAEYDLKLQQLNYDFLGRSNAAATQLDVARLKLDSLMAQQAERFIYATADGIAIYVKAFRPDSKSTVNDRAITVADVSSAAYSLGGSGAQYLTAGQIYTLTINGTDYEAEAIEDDGSFTFYPGVPLAEASQYASITLELDRRDDTLYLPSAAVKSLQEGGYGVYRLNAAGVRELYPVEIGLRVSGKTEILSGLEEGDEVIVG
ncbi:MAG: biotin/lipoyl-binding protein [Oscillospiraceae bacterium]|jgi:multidrug efflux pump subunit AcrA (membrane-fusion protein)|nr:biotin/lipoyl-binding protein [Oscillospiraceae bacterium]